MANGLPSQVPSVPQRGGGKTYSQMVNEQLGLIQRQRAANFEQRLAQEQKNREFREEQLQNIYDFDVSGLASGDAKLLKQLQTELANSLDPNSENSYSSSRELVSDIAFINNVYGEMKRWGQTGGAGRQSYQQSILNPDRGDGTVFSGNEELLDKRNATWEQGAFASAEILGEAGNRQIIGNVLDQDGNVMQEGVDFFENVWRSRPDEFWRPEIAQGALLLDGVALDYAGRSGVDNTNVSEFAGAVFDSDPNIYDRVVRERLIAINQERASQNLPAITIEDTADLESYSLSEKDIRAEYIAKAKEGVGLRPDPKPEEVDPVFSGTVYMDATYGALAGLTKPVELASQDINGKATHALQVEGGIVVRYIDLDKQPQVVLLPEGTDNYFNMINALGPAGVATTVGGLALTGTEEGKESGDKVTVETPMTDERKAYEKYRDDIGEGGKVLAGYCGSRRGLDLPTGNIAVKTVRKLRGKTIEEQRAIIDRAVSELREKLANESRKPTRNRRYSESYRDSYTETTDQQRQLIGDDIERVTSAELALLRLKQLIDDINSGAQPEETES